MSEPVAQVDPALLRQQVDDAIGRSDWASARALLGALWRGAAAAGATAGTASFIVSRYEKLRGNVPLTPCRVAVLRSFTVEPLVPLVRAMGFVAGMDLELRIGDFNTWAQEILDPGSWLYAWEPGAVILAAQARDAAPGLWRDFADLSAGEAEGQIAQAGEAFEQLIGTFRSRSSAHLIVHNLQAPPDPAAGILDAQVEAGQQAAIGRVNARIAESARGRKNVYVLDYAALVARQGAQRWEDVRKWLTVRLPIAAGELIHLAKEWMRFLHPITGKVCKCLVTDLDNTLWGGVIGEDGLEGIKLDAGAGYAWQSLQRAMLDLHRRGILLAIASKNNPPEAREAIEKHPGMLLRPDHFAAMRINWNDKAQGLREIAAELNIGIDALAFIDDNPVERQWVQSQLPEVTVVDLPADPMLYAAALRESPVFERLSLTEEDRERGRMYVEQRMRAELQSSAATLEDFYRSLEMVVEIAPATAGTVARVSQLTQKTNQFNLTTRRYSEQQIAEMMRRPEWNVYALKARDRMGDSGLVGVAITRDEGELCEIDTLLLSCRVIGRTIETAFLAHLAAEARGRGARRLGGWFLPTKKNAPAREFYASHGLARTMERDGGTFWEIGLEASTLAVPSWIELRVTQERTGS